MIHLDLFSGVGCIALGFEQAGFAPVAFAETDPFASRVLAHHWPTVPNLGDVCRIDGRALRDRFGEIDVVTFGSPCQDLSVAGQRAGFAGARSGLFFEAVRIVAECGAALALWENVPGAFTSDRGRDFAAVLDGLAECGAVDIAWRVLDAQYAGVPQRRRRIFVVADFRGERAGEVLFEPEGVSRHFAARGAKGEDIAGSVGPCLESGSNRTGGTRPLGTTVDTIESLIPAVSAKWAKGTGGPSGDECQNLVSVVGPLQSGHSPRGHGSAGVNDQPANSGHIVPIAFAENSRAELRLEGGDGQTTGALKTGGGKPGQSYPAIAFNWQNGGGYGEAHDGLGITEDGTGPVSASQVQAVASSGVRRLTPLECERLMGLPDGWTALLGAADGPRYRACGNGAVVPVVRWIAERMRTALTAQAAA